MGEQAKAIQDAARELAREVNRLRFGEPVAAVYNPLDYAWAAHRSYLERFAAGPKKVVFLGMNPGPWGMAQTGVPFGEIAAVRDWMGIDAPIERPADEHPKRPIEGFACQRSEVSGRRLWALFAERFGTAESFFRDHFVCNYCPLVFMSASGANITPDKLPADERSPLEAACDRHLARVLEILNPRHAVGVGGFATRCLERVIGAGATGELAPRIHTLLHPSPASPIANREWPARPIAQMRAAGIWG